MRKSNPFKEIREKNNLTQKELIKKLEKYCPVSQARISDIENEKNKKSIDKDLVAAYIKVFGVSADYLLGFTIESSGIVDADAVACADYLGINLDSVEHIRDMIKPSKNTIDSLAGYFLKSAGLSDIKKNRAIAEQFEKDSLQHAGFALDCLLSLSLYGGEPGAGDFFEYLYTMMHAYYRYISGDSAADKNQYKLEMFNIQDMIFDFIENQLDADTLKSFAKEYDAKNNANIYDDLFGGSK